MAEERADALAVAPATDLATLLFTLAFDLGALKVRKDRAAYVNDYLARHPEHREMVSCMIFDRKIGSFRHGLSILER